jgi:hypothetical protein
MLKNGVTLFIEKAKEALGTPRDVDFAARLGVGKSTIASWRNRMEIPQDRIKEIEALSGVKYDNIMKNEFERDSHIIVISKIAFFRAAALLFNRANPHDLNKLVNHLLDIEEDTYRLIIARVEDSAKDRIIDNQLLKLIQIAYAGSFLSPEELNEAEGMERDSSKGSSKRDP